MARAVLVHDVASTDPQLLASLKLECGAVVPAEVLQPAGGAGTVAAAWVRSTLASCLRGTPHLICKLCDHRTNHESTLDRDRVLCEVAECPEDMLWGGGWPWAKYRSIKDPDTGEVIGRTPGGGLCGIGCNIYYDVGAPLNLIIPFCYLMCA